MVPKLNLDLTFTAPGKPGAVFFMKMMRVNTDAGFEQFQIGNRGRRRLGCGLGGGVTTLSGTSMAAPHVCGVLLQTDPSLPPGHSGFASGDPDGNADPIVHIQ